MDALRLPLLPLRAVRLLVRGALALAAWGMEPTAGTAATTTVRTARRRLMGYNTRVTGEMRIDPPLTAAEVREWEAINRHPDVKLRVEESTVIVDEGELIKRTAAALVPAWEEPFKAYSLEGDVQTFLNLFGVERLSGYFECSGEEDGDLWRLYIVDGKSTKVEPQIVWPNIP